MSVYHAPKTKKTRKYSWILWVAAIAVIIAAVIVLAVNRPSAADDPLEEGRTLEHSPEAALEAIYADCSTQEIEPLNAAILNDRFGIAPEYYLQAWGGCSSGKYGIADVFIIETYGEEYDDELRELLEQAKTARIVEAQNYDIYDSLEHAENGQIFQVGDYLCLIMIENADEAREILEDCLSD